MDFSKDYSEETCIIFKDGKYVQEKKKIWLSWNPIQQKWYETQTEIEYEGLDKVFPNGLFKRIDGEILIRREAIDNYSLKPVSAYFLQKIRVEAQPQNKHEYVSEFKGSYFLHYLDHDLTTPLSFRTEEPRIKLIGKEKRLTNSEALQKIKEGVNVMSDFGKSGYVKELVN